MKKEMALLCAGILLFVAALLTANSLSGVAFLFFLPAFLLSGWKVIVNAAKSMAKGNLFNENTLMLIAAIGAFCIREYPEAVFVMVFYRVGELFEDYAVRKTRKSISQVMNICPDYANLLDGDRTVRVDPDRVEIGDVIVVAPGERIPLDGIVVEGHSFLDTSALTGESLPAEVGQGDPILSGCINKNATLQIRVTKTFDDSTVSRILELVETASSKKSSSEKFITKFAKYYTPIVLACALALAVVPPLMIDGAVFSDYIYRALSFLVVSCPCALVISVPLAFFGGIGGAAKKGILIKGGNYLEVLSQADTVVFDKTGTLTKGIFSVQKILPVDMNPEALLELAAYGENVSSHPVAQSIREAYGKKINTGRLGASEEIPGQGIKTLVDGKWVYAGNAKLMESIGLHCAADDSGTNIFIAIDGIFAGSIVIADEIKPDAKEGIGALKKSGIQKTVMLTGDVKQPAEHIARQVGIDRVESELLPDQKVAKLEHILSVSKGKTLYVGDGINDAPVLARADAGIAMGALGSDAAIEAADIVIMTDEIGKIETAIRLAKKTMGIARQNIIFSVAVKIAILILCSLHIVGMGVAVFGDVGVMVLAVLNSFRALK